MLPELEVVLRRRTAASEGAAESTGGKIITHSAPVGYTEASGKEPKSQKGDSDDAMLAEPF